MHRARTVAMQVKLSVDCVHKGNEVASIPAQCCAFPFIENGELYYNCTVRSPFIDFGCYNDNRQWVICEELEGMFTMIEFTDMSEVSFR